MKIEVLGPGCANCETLYDNTVKAVEKAGLTETATIEKIKDINVFIEKGVFVTPALIIRGDVVSVGKVLSPEKIIDFLKAADNG